MAGKKGSMNGKVFGSLTVIKINTGVSYFCKCICGNIITKSHATLHRGYKLHCGCLDEIPLWKKHNSEYRSYAAMKSRCYDTKCRQYQYYGARGITICERWLGKDGFKNFFEDMGVRPKGMSLDRIKNDMDYYSYNCKWSTPTEQNNNRRNNIYISDGKTNISLPNYCRVYNYDYKLIKKRLSRGWDLQKAISTPKFESAKDKERRLING